MQRQDMDLTAVKFNQLTLKLIRSLNIIVRYILYEEIHRNLRFGCIMSEMTFKTEMVLWRWYIHIYINTYIYIVIEIIHSPIVALEKMKLKKCP